MVDILSRELGHFLEEFELLGRFYNAMQGHYNPERAYDFEKNNPAIQLLHALNSTTMIYGKGALQVFDDFNKSYGAKNPLIRQFVRVVDRRFSTLERAIRDHMSWNEVKLLGGCHKTLEYLFEVPSDRKVHPLILTTESIGTA